MACATAANNIVQLVRAYDRAFSVRRAPYLISYATYVAATIHARIAANRNIGSDAHNNLGTCLAVFRENQQTNAAVRRANALVQNLMKRLGLQIPRSSEIHVDESTTDKETREYPGPDSNGLLGHEPVLQDLDIDSIIQSFVREPESPQLSRTTLPDNIDTLNISSSSQNRSAFVPPNVQSKPYHDASTLPYDSSGDWMVSGQHALPGDGTVSVEDLFYGFNSSALDSFPITPVLEWDVV
ncbi:hypothetical protein N0V90_002927 [Kalmusia sp. IMI 367209]|nr:hypothetical protein N0V90_002927 [Kalmusia sp. IMI 367209]